MNTQLEAAWDGAITPAMAACARDEGVPPERVRDEVAAGRAVIPANPRHSALRPLVVGRAFRTKINANIGRSTETSSDSEEMHKLEVAIRAGADCVMDLSVGPNLPALRESMLAACAAPFGTVPIYEAFWLAEGKTEKLTSDLLMSVIRRQCEQGVDFMTLHAGCLKRHIPAAMRRTMGIVSRGGAILAEWMNLRGEENPLYSGWAGILDLCRRHDVTVSLGDGLRPGCLADASDEAQFGELEVIGSLVRACRKAGVQVMVEGPGHIPLDQIQMNVERERKECGDAPFYVLGPVVTDIAPGYDHISASIGASLAAYYGASLLCYVTPSEHLALPTAEEVKTGITAFRIAAHAADVAKKIPGARRNDDEMAKARMAFDWERQFSLALDGETARARFLSGQAPAGHEPADHCSMCGREFCAILASKRLGKSS